MNQATTPIPQPQIQQAPAQTPIRSLSPGELGAVAGGPQVQNNDA